MQTCMCVWCHCDLHVGGSDGGGGREGSPTSSCQLPVTQCRPNQRDRGRHGARGAPDFPFPSSRPSISLLAETLFLPPFSLPHRLSPPHVNKCKYLRVNIRVWRHTRIFTRSLNEKFGFRLLLQMTQSNFSLTAMHHLQCHTIGSRCET